MHQVTSSVQDECQSPLSTAVNLSIAGIYKILNGDPLDSSNAFNDPKGILSNIATSVSNYQYQLNDGILSDVGSKSNTITSTQGDVFEENLTKISNNLNAPGVLQNLNTASSKNSIQCKALSCLQDTTKKTKRQRKVKYKSVGCGANVKTNALDLARDNPEIYNINNKKWSTMKADSFETNPVVYYRGRVSRTQQTDPIQKYVLKENFTMMSNNSNATGILPKVHTTRPKNSIQSKDSRYLQNTGKKAKGGIKVKKESIGDGIDEETKTSIKGKKLPGINKIKNKERNKIKPDPHKLTVKTQISKKSKKFIKSKTLKKIKKSEVTERPLTPIPNCHRCEICSTVFESESFLNSHYAKHTFQYKCQICGMGSKLLIEYICHVQTHDPEKLYRCTLCEATKETDHSIKLHLYSTHDHFKKFKCEVCGRGFNIYYCLRQHMNIHTGAKPFKCDKCDARFALSVHLKRHQIQKHDFQNKDTQCPICFKMFTNKASLARHHKLFHEPQAKCDICGKTFKGARSVLRHRRIHAETESHKCRYCEKKFSINYFKLEHEKTHMSLCQKKF